MGGGKHLHFYPHPKPSPLNGEGIIFKIEWYKNEVT